MILVGLQFYSRLTCDEHLVYIQDLGYLNWCHSYFMCRVTEELYFDSPLETSDFSLLQGVQGLS